VERKRLCDASEFLDPNTSLQILIRITRGEERLLLEGTTGGALLTRMMAEMLRRASEDVFGVRLPEEDEMGASVLAPDARARLKERRYGSCRVLGDRETQREFVRLQGLDFGPRVRWYVEGATERGALAEVFGEQGEEGVVLIDLRAQFGRRKNKIDEMRFGESLRQDVDAGVFSYVSLDADNEDTLRAVRTAAKNGRFFGPFFAARPDFELGNFTMAELGEVLWRKAKEAGAPDSAREEFLSAVRGANSGRQLFEKAHEALPGFLGRFEKGEEWGRRLMAYAVEHPEDEQGEKRPIVEAVDSAFSALGANYQRMRDTHRVHPESGRLLPVVPDVTGEDVAEATALLKERGFRLVEPPDGPEGAETSIVGTIPAAGALVEPVTAIRLLHAEGPPEGH
jgi:hypothetical protein